jgi:hypothetical protein
MKQSRRFNGLAVRDRRYAPRSDTHLAVMGVGDCRASRVRIRTGAQGRKKANNLDSTGGDA